MNTQIYPPLCKQAFYIFILSIYLFNFSLANEGEKHQKSFTASIENDAVSGRDQDYTSGVRLGYTRAINKDNFISELFSSFTSIGNTNEQEYLGFSLNHSLFTPETNNSFSQPEGERRYASWIGAQAALIGKSANHQSVLGFTLGATGNPALGEIIQDIIHDVTGAPKFDGWDNEIPSEITLGLSWSHLQNIDISSNFTITPEIILELGTFRTQAILTLGAEYTLWGQLDPFSSPTIHVNSFFTPSSNTDNSLSIFASISEYLVLHDATLDGSLFHNNSTGNEKESTFIQGSIGLKYQTPKWLTTLSYIETSNSYTTQQRNSRIANLTFSYSF